MAEPDSSYERNDVSVPGVTRFAMGLMITVVLILVVLWLFLWALYKVYPGRTLANRDGTPRVTPPAPRLQSNPAEEMQELRVSEDAVLGSYGWVNREAGIVRIPIERAMELTIQRGLPSRQQTQGAPP